MQAMMRNRPAGRLADSVVNGLARLRIALLISPALAISLAISLALAGGLLAASASPAKADPNALWTRVVQVCVKSDPAEDKGNPCDVVNRAADYVLVKDICGPTQYLLLPIRRLTGIESPDLATAPNYFRDAWAERGWVERRAGRKLAPEEIVLALNSIDRRSQNQLHIHLDLARPGLGDALRAHDASLAGNWPAGTWSSFSYLGVDYHLMRLTDLASQNPVALVRARLAAEKGGNGGQAQVDQAQADQAQVDQAQAEMRHQSIGLIGASFADGGHGFYLLNSSFDGKADGSGWAEGLEIDHPRGDCSYRRVPAE